MCRRTSGILHSAPVGIIEKALPLGNFELSVIWANYYSNWGTCILELTDGNGEVTTSGVSYSTYDAYKSKFFQIQNPDGVAR